MPQSSVCTDPSIGADGDFTSLHFVPSDLYAVFMRLSPRLGFRLVLIVIALAFVVARLIPRHFLGSGHSPIHDSSRSSPLNQPGGGPAPPDAYEVYSALYQAPSDEPLVFAAESRTDIPQVGASCLKPTSQSEHELSDAFAAVNQQSHLWEQKFTLSQNYTVLSPEDTVQAQACLQAHDSTSARCAPYRGVRHVRFLGIPGYDRTHTHALVSVIRNCGGFCGSGGIFAVEKRGNTWVRSETTDFDRDCSWIY
jgi:hypothetical protein